MRVRPQAGGTSLKRPWHAAAVVVALGLLGTATYRWVRQGPSPDSALPAAPSPVVPPTVPETTASAPPAPAIAHPIEPLVEEPGVAGPPSAEAALTELFGRKTILSLFQLQDFPRRFVATVDNLGRATAPSGLWPVNPAGGRFLVAERDGTTTIDADNGLRYTPYVLLLETVDLRQVAAVYRALYPQLQRAYEEIGFPRRYFNDRFVEVIDLLLATPQINAPLAVHLPTLNSPVQTERPWVLYEFDDPALQQLSSGQRLLLRMGPVNERRVKARLAELRALLVAPGPTR